MIIITCPKFCKCAVGIYGYNDVHYTKTSIAYNYLDSGDNDNWGIQLINPKRGIDRVECNDDTWYDTNVDYYYAATACLDSDGDGHYAIAPDCPTGDDCDDGNGNNYPGNTEVCDSLDNDCDGLTDEDNVCDLCWSADYGFLTKVGKDKNQPDKFCLCAEGTYGYNSVDYMKTTSAYTYEDSSENTDWTTLFVNSKRAIYQIECTNGIVYPTAQDYYTAPSQNLF